MRTLGFRFTFSYPGPVMDPTIVSFSQNKAGWEADVLNGPREQKWRTNKLELYCGNYNPISIIISHIVFITALQHSHVHQQTGIFPHLELISTSKPNICLNQREFATLYSGWGFPRVFPLPWNAGYINPSPPDTK